MTEDGLNDAQRAMMTIHERRKLLTADPNPSGRLDYVVTIEGRIDGAPPVLPVELTLRYIPDRDVLDAVCLDAYYASVAAQAWESIEQVAVTLLDDFNNELVPRWLSVSVSRRDLQHSSRERHAVVLEDRQPRWDNARLLARLDRY